MGQFSSECDTLPSKTENGTTLNAPIEILSDSDDDNEGVTFAEQPNTSKEAWLETNDINISPRRESQISNTSSASSSTPILNASGGDTSKEAIEHPETKDETNRSPTADNKVLYNSILHGKKRVRNNPGRELLGQTTIKSFPVHSSLDEEELSIMMAMGFDRDECVQAMAQAKNNIDLAINIILNQRQ